MLDLNRASTTFLLGLSALGGGAFAPLLLVLPLQIEGVGPARAGAALGLLMISHRQLQADKRTLTLAYPQPTVRQIIELAA